MSNFLPLNGNVTVAITVNGLPNPLVLGINGTSAPITAGNFVDLVERSFYDGITFHRVVPSFVVQAGDPNSRNPNFPPELLGTSGFTDPVTGQQRTIPLEIAPQGGTPILNQVVNPPVQIPHVRGTISMARANALDSASSQFFIGLDTNAVQPLDGRFAAFGRLVGGVDTLDAIQQGSRIFTAKVVGGIVPGRVSTIITDPVLLNNSVNAINIASLGLSFRDFTNGNDNVTLTPEDTLFNLSGIRAFDGNDTVVGSNEIDYINGNQGNDSLSGRLGNDYIRGGRDADNIFGEDGNDILNGNIGNDIVNGGNGNDFVRGGQDNDILIGGAGNDVLVGDFGSDVLTGNAGADTFVLRVATAGTDPLLADFVTDFNVGEGDRILVAGDISPTALTFLPIGNGTQIQLTATAQVLGVVENIPAATVQAATIVTLTGDAALRVG